MLDRYLNLLKSGQLVAFPTETVYGLGADAQNPEAVRKIFKIKQRPLDNPLIVHISSYKMLDEFTDEIPEEAEQLVKAFWPGPLTLIFKKKPKVLDLVTAGLDTVAIRWPSHPLSQDLIARSGALAAPSANTSGKPSPTKPEHVKEDFGKSFPIVEAGETQIGLESTVLDVSQKPFKLHRPGNISRNQIENIINAVIEIADSQKSETPKSPGTKYSHYAPEAQVSWLQIDDSLNSKETLYLLHSKTEQLERDNIIYFNENFTEMAHQLYDHFRSADHRNLNRIAIEPITKDAMKREPLAEALVNRISKAIGSSR